MKNFASSIDFFPIVENGTSLNVQSRYGAFSTMCDPPSNGSSIINVLNLPVNIFEDNTNNPSRTFNSVVIDAIISTPQGATPTSTIANDLQENYRAKAVYVVKPPALTSGVNYSDIEFSIMENTAAPNFSPNQGITIDTLGANNKVVLDDGKFNFYLHASNDTINNSKFILVKGTYLLM